MFPHYQVKLKTTNFEVNHYSAFDLTGCLQLLQKVVPISSFPVICGKFFQSAVEFGRFRYNGRCSMFWFLTQKYSDTDVPACAAIAGRPVVRPARPLVSFALFASGGGGSTVVAADTSALSTRNRKLDATGPVIHCLWPDDSADVIFKAGFHYPSLCPVHVARHISQVIIDVILA